MLTSSTGRHGRWGLLVLRLTVGVIMVAAGWMKLFDFGVGSFAKALAMEGVPLPAFFAWAVTLLELVGGTLLMIGLLSRVLALLLTVDMVVAMLLVTLEVGFLSPTGRSGAEFNFVLIGCLLAIVLAGPGSISVDRVLEEKPAEPDDRGAAA